MARHTPAGARTGDTRPTPDNGDTDLNVDTTAPQADAQADAPQADAPPADDFRPADQSPPADDFRPADQSPPADDFRPADQSPPAGEGGTVAPGTDPSNVEKVSVKTTGDHMFSDPYTREMVDPGETKSIIRSTFVENALANGQLEEA